MRFQISSVTRVIVDHVVHDRHRKNFAFAFCINRNGNCTRQCELALQKLVSDWLHHKLPSDFCIVNFVQTEL